MSKAVTFNQLQRTLEHQLALRFARDGEGNGATWSTVVNFHHGDAVALFGYQDGTSTRPWTALDGAAGWQGATIHPELGGAGTGVDASVTLAGLSLADAPAKLATSTGSGASYLYVACTGTSPARVEGLPPPVARAGAGRALVPEQ